MGSVFRFFARVFVMAVLTVATACSGTRSGPDPFDAANGPSSSGAGQIRITVENQNFNDVRVSVVTLRGPQVLGQVGGQAAHTFTLEWPAVTDMSFELNFLADATYPTNRITAAPGDHVEVQIPRNPRNTIVRRR